MRLDLVLERRLVGFGRLLDTGAFTVELPTVITTAKSTLLDHAVHQRGRPVGAATLVSLRMEAQRRTSSEPFSRTLVIEARLSMDHRHTETRGP